MSITVLSEARPSAVASVRSLAAELGDVVGSLDAASVAGLSGREAAALTALFAEIERLASAGQTVCAGRVAETGQYRAEGCSSPARWLAGVAKTSVGDAGRTIATASHLADDALAPTRAAFVGGSLTGAQANELASTVASKPGEQERLLDLAGSETTKTFRDECRKVRLAGKPAGRPKRQADEMRLSMRDLGDGMSDLFARMPTAWAVRAMAAIREQADAVFARARADGRDDPHQAYLVEALVTLLLIGPLGPPGTGGAAGGRRAEPSEAETSGSPGDAASGEAAGGDGVVESRPGDDVIADAMADDDEAAGAGAGEVIDDHDPTNAAAGDGAGGDGTDDECSIDDADYEALRAMLSGGSGPPVRSREHRRRRAAGLPRAKILVRVDQPALLRGYAEGDETCDIAGVGPVSVATVRDLWPDAVVKLVLTNGVDVVNVTHLGRRGTEAMTSAMQWRATQCSNGACDNDRFLEIDHRLGWANVHRTRVDELDALCSTCHGLKTTGNWQLVRGSGRRRFVPPEHPDHPGDPPTPVRRRE